MNNHYIIGAGGAGAVYFVNGVYNYYQAAKTGNLQRKNQAQSTIALGLGIIALASVAFYLNSVSLTAYAQDCEAPTVPQCPLDQLKKILDKSQLTDAKEHFDVVNNSTMYSITCDNYLSHAHIYRSEDTSFIDQIQASDLSHPVSWGIANGRAVMALRYRCEDTTGGATHGAVSLFQRYGNYGPFMTEGDFAAPPCYSHYIGWRVFKELIQTGRAQIETVVNGIRTIVLE